MDITLVLVAALALCSVAGFGIIGALWAFSGNSKRTEMVLLLPVTGYALLQIVFVMLYRFRENSVFDLKLTMLICSLLVVASIALIVYRLKDLSRQALRFPALSPQLAIALLVVIVLAAWPYALIGQGHYYHSGNEDFFEGIFGGNSYVQNTPVALQHDDYKEGLRLQYSSQAFWRVLFGLSGIDAFMVNALLDLLFLALGTFWLVRFVFDGEDKSAAWVATLSALSSFYFTTFLAGHIGSMMYGAAAPFIVGIVLQWSRREIPIIWLVLVGLLVVFVSIAYPGPVNFIVVPLVLVVLHERVLLRFGIWRKTGTFIGWKSSLPIVSILRKLRWGRIFALLLPVLTGVFFLARIAQAYIETRQLFQMLLLRAQVSWGVTLSKEIIPIMWGIYPSNLVGTASQLRSLISNSWINTAAMAVSFVALLALCAAVISYVKHPRRHFLALYLIAAPGFYLMMREFWGSPYYVYKFLYVNFFIVVIGLGLWTYEHLRCWIGPKRWTMVVGTVFLIAINMFWNTRNQLDIVGRPYHQVAQIEEFLRAVPHGELEESALDIPNEVNRNVIRELLRDRGIKFLYDREKAKYLVQFPQFRTVAYTAFAEDSVLYGNELLRLVMRPSVDDILIRSLYETDNIDGMRINWMGNEVSELADRIQQPLAELTSYVRQQNIAGATHLDIRAPYVEALVSLACRKANIELQIDPSKAKWFLRQRFTEFNPIVHRGALFATLGNERILYQNRLFIIVDLPFEGRVVSDANAYDLGRTYEGLTRAVARYGNKVFLDMPPYEHATLFVRQLLRKAGATVVDAPSVDVVLRLMLPGYLQSLSYKTVRSSKEEILWDSPTDGLSLQLLRIPLNDRTLYHDIAADSLQYKNLFTPSLGDFQIFVRHPSPRARFLRLLIEPGPSIDFRDFNLAQISPSGLVLDRWPVYAPTTCLDVSVDKARKVGVGLLALNFLGENLIGKSLLPVEERLLNYSLKAVELTDSIGPYSRQMLSIIDPMKGGTRSAAAIVRRNTVSDDIVERRSRESICLGTGWYPFETFAGKDFRWVRNDATIIVLKTTTGARSVRVAMERGPSLLQPEPTLIMTLNGKAIDSLKLTSLHRREFLIPDGRLKVGDVLTLHLDADGNPILGDQRTLNFRVFSVSLEQR